jgi:hypothetical protein
MCDAYLASRREDPVLLALVAREWSHDGREFSTDEVRCDGCTREGGRLFAGCAHCAVRECCSGRDLVHCGLCEEFPCDILHTSPDPAIVSRLRSLAGG